VAAGIGASVQGAARQAVGVVETCPICDGWRIRFVTHSDRGKVVGPGSYVGWSRKLRRKSGVRSEGRGFRAGVFARGAEGGRAYRVDCKATDAVVEREEQPRQTLRETRRR